VATPPPLLTASSYLESVSCIKPGSCLVVGWQNLGNSPNTGCGCMEAAFAYRWDGKRWYNDSSVAQPVGSLGTNFQAVSCRSATWCEAVGVYDMPPQQDTSVSLPLAELWNGQTWTVQSTPMPGGALNPLNRVSCSSTTFCLATGSEAAELVPFNIGYAMVFEGGHWSLTNIPVTSNFDGDDLEGVSCTSSSNCYVTGDYIPNDLILHWAGRALRFSWLSPHPFHGSLHAVACTLTACEAVGFAASSTGQTTKAARKG
jgi:hypothetical protein